MNKEFIMVIGYYKIVKASGDVHGRLVMGVPELSKVYMDSSQEEKMEIKKGSEDKDKLKSVYLLEFVFVSHQLQPQQEPK